MPDYLHFDLISTDLINLRHQQRKTLYPYQTELAVVFFYGNDYTRAMNLLFIPRYVQVSTSSIVVFIFLAVIVLSMIRKKLGLRRSDFVSTFIDTVIPFIGGGNVRIEHKWEKWFFGIVIIGAFLITSTFTGVLLDCVYLLFSQKITTLKTIVFNQSTNSCQIIYESWRS